LKEFDWEIFFILKVLEEEGPLSLEELFEAMVRRGYIGKA